MLSKDSSQSHILGSAQKDSSLNRLIRQYAYSNAAPTHIGFDSDVRAFTLVGLNRCTLIIYFFVDFQRAVGFRDVSDLSRLNIAHSLLRSSCGRLCCFFVSNMAELGGFFFFSFFLFFKNRAQVGAQL